MVVVEQARTYIGTNVDVMVTGLHQTQSGRMLFGVLHTKEHNQKEEPRKLKLNASLKP